MEMLLIKYSCSVVSMPVNVSLTCSRLICNARKILLCFQGAIFLFFAGRTEEIKGNIDEVWFIKYVSYTAWNNDSFILLSQILHKQIKVNVCTLSCRCQMYFSTVCLYWLAVSPNLVTPPGGGAIWRWLQGPAGMEAVPPHVLLGADVVLHL